MKSTDAKTPKLTQLNRLVYSPRESSSLKHKVLVEGMNLGMEINDSLVDVVTFEGPLSEQTAIGAKELGYNVTVLPSFYFPDKFGKFIDPTDYNTNIFNKIVAPKNFSETSWPYLIKLYGQTLTYPEVCRILNHMSAWEYSIRTNKSIIILEQGSFLTRKVDSVYPRYNSINMLGDLYYHQHNENWVCASGVFAYALDCRAARNLFNKVMSDGLINPLHLLFRVDQFNVVLNKSACRVHIVDNLQGILN